MKKKLLVVAGLGVVLTVGCGAKESKMIETQVSEIETVVAESTAPSTEEVEVESSTEVSEYPKEVAFDEMPPMVFREDGLMSVSLEYNGNSFGFVTGKTDTDQIIRVDVVNAGKVLSSEIAKVGDNYYLINLDGENSSFYKLTETEIANLDSDLGISEFGSAESFVITQDMISSIIQVDDLSYVVTDSDGYESDILYDEDGYVSSMSATQAEMYTVVNFGTADELGLEISTLKSDYIDFIETAEEMTYADAVKSFADVFLNGFVSMEQSDVDETEQTEDLIDYDGMLYDIVPTETDEVTGYIYSIAKNGVCIASNDLSFKCIVADGVVKARMYTYAGTDLEIKQAEFETNAIDLVNRVLQG